MFPDEVKSIFPCDFLPSVPPMQMFSGSTRSFLPKVAQSSLLQPPVTPDYVLGTCTLGGDLWHFTSGDPQVAAPVLEILFGCLPPEESGL